jgi:hypothetical protein
MVLVRASLLLSSKAEIALTHYLNQAYWRIKGLKVGVRLELFLNVSGVAVVKVMRMGLI